MSRFWPKHFTSPPNKPLNLIGYEDIHAQIVNIQVNRSGERVALWGPAGAGKTALAHRLTMDPAIASHFQDGILWARPVEYVHKSALLGAWAEVLCGDLSRVTRMDERKATLQSLLHDRRVLIILDGVRDEQTLADLGCGGPHTSTILTTRDEQLAQSFAGSSEIWKIEGLNPVQADKYLSSQFQFIDWRAVFSNWNIPEDSPISPQVLKLIAGHLDVQTAFPGIIQHPENSIPIHKVEGYFIPEVPLDLAREINYRKIAGWILDSLPGRIQEIFKNMLAFAGEPDSLSIEAALQVTDSTGQDLEVLVTANLIERDEKQLTIPSAIADVFSRYRSLEGQARHRQYYSNIASSFSGQPAEISGIYGQSMFSCQIKRLEENRREIVNALSAYQEELSLWEDYQACAELALQACKAHSLCQEEGRLCNNLGKAAHMLSDVQVAMSYYQLAKDLLGTDGEIIERALVMNNIASLLVVEGKHEEAKVELLQAILLLDKPEDHHLQAYLHNNLGKIYDDMILPVLARDEYLKALQLLDSGSDQELELTVRFNLALVYLALGKKQEAIDELQRAVEIEETIGHPNFDVDLKLLDKLRGEMNEPKVIRWIRKRIIN